MPDRAASPSSPERGDLSQQGNQAALRPPVGALPARRRCGASQIGTPNRRLGAGDPPVLEQPWSRTEYLFGRRTRSLGRLSKLSHKAGTRAQAPPAMLGERHGRRGSHATWSPALPLPAAVPVGYGPCAESPASDLLWRLAAGDCLMRVQLGLMGVQLGGKVIWAGLRGCGCGAGTAGQQREAVTVLP